MGSCLDAAASLGMHGYFISDVIDRVSDGSHAKHDSCRKSAPPDDTSDART
jgi:hypothetical protein